MTMKQWQNWGMLLLGCVFRTKVTEVSGAT